MKMQSSAELILGGAILLMAPSAFAVESACATSTAIRVCSVMTGERKSVTQFDVEYAPSWSVASPDDTAYVVISQVEHADTTKAVTNVVMTGKPGAEGSMQIAPGTDGLASCRLIHQVFVGDEPAGTALISDIAIGVTSPLAMAVAVDSRTNSLQCVVEAKTVAPLTYASDWVTNGEPAHVVLTKIHDRYRSGRSSVTTELMRVTAPVDGVFDFYPQDEGGGFFTLSCAFLDASGKTLDIEEAHYRFDETWGTVLLIR